MHPETVCVWCCLLKRSSWKGFGDHEGKHNQYENTSSAKPAQRSRTQHELCYIIAINREASMILERRSRSVLKLQIIFTFVCSITVVLCIYFWSPSKDVEGGKWFPILKKVLPVWDLDLGPCVATSFGFRNTCFTKITGVCIRVCVHVCVQVQGSNYRGQWWIQRGRWTLPGWYIEEQVLSSKTQEVVEHTWQMSSLLGDKLTMAQPGFWCFPLAPGVLNHFLENANAPTEGSTSVLNGLWPVV